MKLFAAAIAFTIAATSAQASGCWQVVRTTDNAVLRNCVPSLQRCQSLASMQNGVCVFVQK